MVFLGGTTIHTGLDFKYGRKYLPLNDHAREKIRLELEDLQLIIVDEMSMVSADMLYMIHKRLCEIFVSDDYFGGRAIMFVGDLMQLRPVKGAFIFEKPKNKKYYSLYQVDSLWKTFEPIILKTNFRQGEGSLFNDILNRARIGELTDEDKAILETRRVGLLKDKSILSEAFHVFWTNKETENLNMQKLAELDSPLEIVKAQIFSPRGYKPKITNYGTIDDTQFMKILKIKVGARVMLTFNISISDSLINGELGTIVDITKSNGYIQEILVQFDNEETGTSYRKAYMQILDNKYPNATPIKISSLEYVAKNKKSGNFHGCKIKVTQFALRLSWAATCHRVQGISMPKGQDLVAHGHQKIPAAMQYVMMGRVSSLDNLYLSENFDLNKVRCIKAALKENNRLKDLFSKRISKEYDISFMNIRSLRQHHEDLVKDPILESSKIMCLAETWIYPNEEDSSWIDVPGMQKTLSSHGRGKGCCIYYREENLENIKKFSSENFQLIAGTYKKIQVYVLYVSKGEDDDSIVQVMKKLITPGPLIVIGDFNVESNVDNSLSKFLSAQGLIQIVKRPTHIQGGKIDHCYVLREWKDDFKIDYIFPYYTDHIALCMSFPPQP